MEKENQLLPPQEEQKELEKDLWDVSKSQVCLFDDSSEGQISSDNSDSSDNHDRPFSPAASTLPALGNASEIPRKHRKKTKAVKETQTIGRKKENERSEKSKTSKRSKKPKPTSPVDQQKLEALRKRGEIALETQELLSSIYEDTNQQRIQDAKNQLFDRIRMNLKTRETAQQRKTKRQQHRSAQVGPFSIPVVRAKENPLRNGKGRILRQLKASALKQGAEEMAKLFGYASYEEQRKHLRHLEQVKKEMKSKEDEQDKVHDAEEVSGREEENSVVDESAATIMVEEMEEIDISTHKEQKVLGTTYPSESSTDQKDVSAGSESTEMRVAKEAIVVSSEAVDENNGEHENEKDEEDGEENNSESPGESNALGRSDLQESFDKAAAFRSMLLAEENQSKQKSKGLNFVEHEAEEEQDENQLQISGLGDFGFIVPKNKNLSEKGDDYKATLTEDDLKDIVDDLSDTEKDKEDAGDFFRADDIQNDDLEIEEVMRNMKEGFGRKQRAFSGLGKARGKFNLDELVAADGSKEEAARLGLLESDEELSDDGKNDGEGDGEDEETKLERMIRQRHALHENVYITSSEDESGESDHEQVSNTLDNAIESDEERERIQMKSFNQKAKRNRRMHRMAMSQENISTSSIFQNDEESQQLFKSLTRTNEPQLLDVEKVQSTDEYFNSSGFGLSSTSNSFLRGVESLKGFHGPMGNSKTFVFASLDEQSADMAKNEGISTTSSSSVYPTKKAGIGFQKRKQSSENNKSLAIPTGKKKVKKASLFQALAQYQCKKL